MGVVVTLRRVGCWIHCKKQNPGPFPARGISLSSYRAIFGSRRREATLLKTARLSQNRKLTQNYLLGNVPIHRRDFTTFHVEDYAHRVRFPHTSPTVALARL